MDHGVGFTDVGEKLVAQPFALAGTGNQAGNIDEFDDGRLNSLRLDDGRQGRQPGSGTSTMPTFARWCRTDSSPPRCPTWSAH